MFELLLIVFICTLITWVGIFIILNMNKTKEEQYNNMECCEKPNHYMSTDFMIADDIRLANIKIETDPERKVSNIDTDDIKTEDLKKSKTPNIIDRPIVNEKTSKKKTNSKKATAKPKVESIVNKISEEINDLTELKAEVEKLEKSTKKVKKTRTKKSSKKDKKEDN